MSTPNLQGWLPFQVDWTTEGPHVHWCNAGPIRLAKPSYAETIGEVFRTPFNVIFRHQTPLDALTDWRQESPGIPPTGFILQLSRGRSSHLCRMLAAIEKHVVVSDAPPLDELLRGTKLNEVTEAKRIEWLRGMISALGQERAGGESQLFVKFNDWHTLDLPLIRKAFPEVPWIVVFRDPVEILASQSAAPDLHSCPGLMKFGVPDIDQMQAGLVTREVFCARVLAHVSEAALAALAEPDSNGIAINEAELPEAVFTRMANHFRLALTPEDQQNMRGMTTNLPSQPDGSRAISEACATWVPSVYDRFREVAARY